ncbi:MAG: SPOR domain-containing protein [Mariprofundaceae bacterium]
MPAIEKQQNPWLAGFQEHRIALGIAAAASLAMIVLLVLATDETPENKSLEKNNPVASDAPLYTLPQRHLEHAPASKTKQQLKPARSMPDKPTSTAPTKRKKGTGKQTIVSEKTIRTKTTPTSGTQPEHRSKVETTTHSTVFFVQIAAYREKNSAQQQAATLMQKGWNSMVTRNTKGLHVVRIGPVADRPAAIILHRKLVDKAHLKGFIVRGG